MKLTELKNSIDEALRQHSDYDVVVNGLDIEDCGIDSGRFNFNIEVNDCPECDRFHINEDVYMEYCIDCNIYHPSGEHCPGCNIKKIKKSVKKALLPY